MIADRKAMDRAARHGRIWAPARNPGTVPRVPRPPQQADRRVYTLPVVALRHL